MNANDNLEREIADAYHAEAPHRAPDWVLANALETIESTPQRRVLIRVPWRFPDMNNTFAKLAIAAVAVLVIGVVGLNMLSPRGSSNVGGPAPSASPSPSLSPSPSPSPDPHAPPPLSETFTSTVNGLSISYPKGWVTARATEPWTASSDPNYGSAARDQVHDPVVKDHLFFSMASQPLSGKTADAWVAAVLAEPEDGCAGQPIEPTAIDGTPGQMCDGLAAVAAGGRGYFVRLYTSSDEPWIRPNYDYAWFKTVLETVQLDPASATDGSASTSPKASASS